MGVTDGIADADGPGEPLGPGGPEGPGRPCKPWLFHESFVSPFRHFEEILSAPVFVLTQPFMTLFGVVDRAGMAQTPIEMSKIAVIAVKIFFTVPPMASSYLNAISW